MSFSHLTDWSDLDDAKYKLAKYIELLSDESDYRKARKIARSLAHAGARLAEFDDNLDLEAIEVGLTAIALAHRRGGRIDDSARGVGRLVSQKMEILGIDEPDVLAEKQKSTWTDGATLVVTGSPAIGRESMCIFGEERLEIINSGASFLVSLSADGGYSCRLRVVNAPEPMLKRKEYSKVQNSTDVGFVDVTSEQLFFGGAEVADKGAMCAVENGRYLVRVFELGQYSKTRMIAVACPSIGAEPHLTFEPELR